LYLCDSYKQNDENGLHTTTLEQPTKW